MVGACRRRVLLRRAGDKESEQHDDEPHHAASSGLLALLSFLASNHTILYNARAWHFIVPVPRQGAKLRLSARREG